MVPIRLLVALIAVCVASIAPTSLEISEETLENVPSAGGATHDHSTGAASGGTSANTASPTFYSEMAMANARMHAGMDVAPTGDTDRDFVHMMIPHHQGAVDMARIQLKYGKSEILRRMAQSIIVAQHQEIKYMHKLLRDLPEGTSSSNHPVGK